MSQLSDDIRRVLAAWKAPNQEQAELQARFLAHALAEEQPGSRECAPDHVTASTLVLSAEGGRVVLVLHPKFGRWLQTGGHCEPTDTSLAGAALREAREETGVDDLLLDEAPLLLSRHRVPCHENGHHLDVQFLAIAPVGAEPVCSNESDDVRWFGVDQLPDSTDESVIDLVHAAIARRQGTPSLG